MQVYQAGDSSQKRIYRLNKLEQIEWLEAVLLMLMGYTTYTFNEPDICTSRFHVNFFFWLLIWQLWKFTVMSNHSRYRIFVVKLTLVCGDLLLKLRGTDVPAETKTR
jgi:hypothetical protein